MPDLIKPHHICHYEWVNCTDCLPSTIKGSPCGYVTGAGLDMYGNPCNYCKGKGKVALCAQCEREFERELRKKGNQ